MRLTTEFRVEGFEGRGGGSDVEVADVEEDVALEEGVDELAGEDARAANFGVSKFHMLADD